MGLFLDTNVLLYAFTEDAKQGAARSIVRRGGVVSVQCLNEFVAASRRKLRLDWPIVEENLTSIRRWCSVVSVDIATHEDALRLAGKYKFPFYDACIAAAALRAGCDRLLTEDFHHGLVIDGRLTVENPFR